MFTNRIDNQLQIGNLILTRKLFISVNDHSAFLVATQQNKKIIVGLDDSLDLNIRGLFYSKKSSQFADIAALLNAQDCAEAKEIAMLITAEIQQAKEKPARRCCRIS